MEGIFLAKADMQGCSQTGVKTEPPDMSSDSYESKVSPQKKRKLAARALFIICSKCGKTCKGQKGLKLHLSTTHKRNSSNNYKHKNSPVVKTKKIIQFKEEQPDKASEQCKNSFMCSTNNQPFFVHNTVSNLDQIVQTGLICNMLPIQNQPVDNIIKIENQPKMQILPFHTNQSPTVEIIPKFDPECEKYIMWLKRFINRDAMRKYPLTSMLCQSVSHINEEITDALANPVGSMTKRSNHSYFMKFKSLLSEIMLGQMRYSLNVGK